MPASEEVPVRNPALRDSEAGRPRENFFQITYYASIALFICQAVVLYA